MNDEELDLLASSYLDGEATPDEVALIERDPELLARIDELRVAQAAVRAPVPQPSMRLKEDHLAAALAAFDATGAADDRPTTLLAVETPAEPTEPDHTGPVVDLREHRERRAEQQAAAAGRMRWLSAVAGVLVFAAGAVFLVSQVNGGGDDEFAGAVADDGETDASAEAQLAESAPAAADDTDADETAADDGSDAAIASEAMPADAEGDFAAEDSAEIEEEAADEEAADGDDAAADAPVIQDLAEEGFFGDEPVVSYSEIPTSDELLAEVDLPWRDPEFANCSGQAELPPGGEIIGYLPIEIPADDGSGETARVVEALYLTVGNESQVILVAPDTCEEI